MALQSSILGPPAFSIGTKPFSLLHCYRYKAVPVRIFRSNNRYPSLYSSNCVQFRSSGSILCTVYEETDAFANGARLGCGVSANSNCSSVPEPNRDFVREIAKRGVVFTAIVYGVLVVGCKNVLATEGVVSFGRDVVGQGILSFRNAWPKALLVLKIFKEQGLILALLLGLSAFFSMAETSITTLWPWKVTYLLHFIYYRSLRLSHLIYKSNCFFCQSIAYTCCMFLNSTKQP